jgi:hypothetical protein
MLGGGLPGHVQLFAKLAERLSVLLAQKIQQLSARRISKRLEYLVCVHQPRSYLRIEYAGIYLHVK